MPRGPLSEKQRAAIAASGITAINVTVSGDTFEASTRNLALSSATAAWNPVMLASAPSVEMLMRQIDHALKVCGTDHVGIGSDLSTTPIDETPEYLREAKAFVDARASRGISAPDETRPLFIPELNHSRRIEGVARGLQQRGHPAAVIEKIIGGNFHRAFKEIWTL